MIPYLEIYNWTSDKTRLQRKALIEPSETWLEIAYYDKVEFEIYAAASASNLTALQIGNFVKIPHKPYLWLIKSIQYEYNSEGARMISAKGYEASKAILEQRIIKYPLQLPTSLQEAITLLIDTNIGNQAETNRQIAGFDYELTGLEGIETEAQATRSNLWEYINNLLKENKIGSYSILGSNNKIIFKTTKGQDKSNSIIFSQSFDNLISSTFYTSDEEEKTDCQIVSTFTSSENGVQTSTDYVEYYPSESGITAGIERKEIILQSNLSTKIKNEQGEEVEITPDSETYRNMQKAEGASLLATKTIITNFEGEIDLANSMYEFEKDFFIGDLVGVKDEYFGFAAKARINKYTFKQDYKGYGEEAEYFTE